MKISLWSCIALALTILSCVQPSLAQSPSDSLAPTLIMLAQLYNVTLSNVEAQTPLGASGSNAAVSWQALTAAAKKLNLPLAVRHVTLPALRQRGGTALLHLKNPEQFVVLKAIGPRQALIYAQGDDQLIGYEALAHRFGGEALVLAAPPKSQSWLRVDNPIRVVAIDTLGGAEIVEKVTMTNRSKQPLQLIVARTSCGCTGAEFTPPILASGQSGILTMKMHAEQSHLVTVMLRTNDPLWSWTVVALQANLPITKIRPPQPLAISGLKGQSTRGDTTLTLPAGDTILKLTTQHPFVTAKVATIEPSPGGQVYHIVTSVAADAPAGSFTDQLTIELKDANVGRVVVPINGFIDADIALNPRLITLGAVANGMTVQRTVTVQDPGGKQFALKSIQSNNPHNTAQAALTTMPARHEIKVAITVAGEVGSALQDRVKLTLSDGRELDLDILGAVASAIAPQPPTTDG